MLFPDIPQLKTRSWDGWLSSTYSRLQYNPQNPFKFSYKMALEYGVVDLVRDNSKF